MISNEFADRLAAAQGTAGLMGQGLGNVPESVSWACDAQECERSGGVAGVAAQRGGEVAVAP
jgi:hypothetical protein